MKNLKKNLLLLIIIFPLIMLLSSAFAEKALAINSPLTLIVTPIVPSCWRCSSPPSYSSTIADSICDHYCGENSNTSSECFSKACVSSPTTTPTPSSCSQILDLNTCIDNGCVWNIIADSCRTKSSAPTPASTLVWKRILCQAPTPTATVSTPALFTCANQTGPFSGNYQCRSIVNDSVQCDTGFNSFSTPSSYAGTSCATNQGCCKQGSTQSANPFACTNQETGGFTGNYTCAPFVNGFTQCSPGFSEFTPNSTTFTGISCNSGQRCCKKDPIPTATPTPTPTARPTPTPTLNPALTPNCPINDANVFCSPASPGTSCGLLYSVQTANCPLPNQCWRCAAPTPTPTSVPSPTATPTVTPTPVPGSVQLALSVAQQGLTSTPLNIGRQVTVILKGADGQKLPPKTGTVTYSGGTFNGTINLGVLPNGSYKSKVQVGSFLKSLTADLVISGTAASAQTKVIAGLDEQDDVDAILFYNGLKACFGSNIGFKKTGCTTPQDVDLNGDGNADIIDYQIYLKGIRNLQQGLPVI